MQQHHIFVRDDIMPSWWANAIQRRLAVGVDGLRLQLASSTVVEIPAGPNEAAVVVTIDGKWRYAEATLSRAHPGGGAGVYAIFVVAKNNDIRSVPLLGSDFTDYAFDLRIVADGSEPPIVAGSVEIHRRIGYCVWNGAAITSLVQEVGVGAVGGELAGTLPVPTIGVLGSGRALNWNNDTFLRRLALASLGTDGAFSSGGLLTAGNGLNISNGSINHLGVFLNLIASGTITWANGDTVLERIAAGRLRTAGLDLTGSLARPVVTVLPAAANYDGREVLLQTAAMAAAGVGPWVFRYRAGSASAYKWECVGAARWVQHSNAAQFLNSGAYADLPGMQVDLPAEGDYELDFGGYLQLGTPGASAFLRPEAGGLVHSAGSPHLNAVQLGSGTADDPGANVARTMRLNGISGSLRLAGQGPGINQAEVRNFFQAVRPIRLA